ncbi:DNA-binding transcriptional regulator, LysR family [Paracoccus aminovorans]|uniref:DNA-binding transcriptional regulator, LysR family n=2 Tax=Paracoccus aminovorans TaxID=34004 RepID=A0A1I3EID0_9RHOB|nr:DNA-binding transcriptional regulator, LysR family [Paracoccus aminovorans]
MVGMLILDGTGILKLNIRMSISEKSNVSFGTDLLRAFVAVVDASSFTAAASHLNSTQSTVSQKILRLEDLARVRLLDRGPRGIRPTEAGERLLGYARRILMLNDEAAAALSGAARRVTLRLGLPEDFASGQVTPALAAFMRTRPQLKLEVTSGLSRDLYRRYRQGEFDLVLVKQNRNGDRGRMHWPEPLVWLESADGAMTAADPLPLVAFPPDGLYRAEMIDALDRAGRDWQLVYTSSSLAGLQSAIAAGLGIGLLPRRASLPGLREIGLLPTVEDMEIAIHCADSDIPFMGDMIAILAAAVESGKPLPGCGA